MSAPSATSCSAVRARSPCPLERASLIGGAYGTGAFLPARGSERKSRAGLLSWPAASARGARAPKRSPDLPVGRIATTPPNRTTPAQPRSEPTEGSLEHPRHLGLLSRQRRRLVATARSSPRRRKSASPARSTTTASRRKAIEYCLAEAGIAPEQLDFVAFYDKPLLKFDRLLETYLAFAPAGFRLFLMGAAAVAEAEALHAARARSRPRRRVQGPLRLPRAPRVARRQRVLPVAVRRSRDPDARRRRRVGDRHASGSGAATGSSC